MLAREVTAQINKGNNERVTESGKHVDDNY